jgi:hypothetical protein
MFELVRVYYPARLIDSVARVSAGLEVEVEEVNNDQDNAPVDEEEKDDDDEEEDDAEEERQAGNGDGEDEVFDAANRVTFNQVVHVYFNGSFVDYMAWADQA